MAQPNLLEVDWSKIPGAHPMTARRHTSSA